MFPRLGVVEEPATLHDQARYFFRKVLFNVPVKNLFLLFIKNTAWALRV